MVFYYEQTQPIYSSFVVLSRTSTTFGTVSKRTEFWFFIALHVAMMLLLRLEIIPRENLESFNWQAVETFTLFTVFAITFYNGHCFQRYTMLYYACMNMLDSLMFFVHEMIVSMSHTNLEHHRITASKYMLAIAHVFFMGVTGGMQQTKDYRELVRRGLLTKMEATQLACLAGGFVEGVLVLAAWCMQVVDLALHDPCLTTPQDKVLGAAHIHNRLGEHVDMVLQSVHDIVDVMSLPIPFQYFHCMNVVIILDLAMVCIIAATYETYMTFFPVFVVIFVFLGLREVSTSLADPFNAGDSDFPVSSFIQYAFDAAVCLLECFRHEFTSHYAKRVVAHTRNFSPEQLSFLASSVLLYTKNYDPATSSPFSWNREYMVQKYGGSAAEKMKESALTASVAKQFRLGRRSSLSKGRPPDQVSTMKVVVQAGLHHSDDVPEAETRKEAKLSLRERIKQKVVTLAKQLRDKCKRKKKKKVKKKHGDNVKDKARAKDKEKRKELLPVQRELQFARKRNARLEVEIGELQTTITVNRRFITGMGCEADLAKLDEDWKKESREDEDEEEPGLNPDLVMLEDGRRRSAMPSTKQPPRPSQPPAAKSALASRVSDAGQDRRDQQRRSQARSEAPSRAREALPSQRPSEVPSRISIRPPTEEALSQRTRASERTARSSTFSLAAASVLEFEPVVDIYEARDQLREILEATADGEEHMVLARRLRELSKEDEARRSQRLAADTPSKGARSSSRPETVVSLDEVERCASVSSLVQARRPRQKRSSRMSTVDVDELNIDDIDSLDLDGFDLDGASDARGSVASASPRRHTSQDILADPRSAASFGVTLVEV